MSVKRKLDSKETESPSLKLSKPLASIDFETRSRIDLTKAGAYRYAQDRSTEILCLAYNLGDGKGTRVWNPLEEDEPDELIEHVSLGGIVTAHNAEFEFAVWNYHCRKKYGWPPLLINQIKCSAATAAALSLPRSLDTLAVVLRTKTQKDSEGRKLMLKMSKPRKPTKKNPDEWFDTPEARARLMAYCMTDVNTELDCSKFMRPLIPQEEKLFRLSMRINNRGIYCDLPLARTAFEFSKRYETELLEELGDLTNGEVKSVKQVAVMRAYLEREGIRLDNLQALTVDAALKAEPFLGTPKARRILELRALLGKSSIAKFARMLASAGPDSRIRGTQLYHGATTGRYTGKIIQPQNFPQGKIKDVENIFAALKEGDYEWFKFLFSDVQTALASALRGMLRAAPGNVLNVADFSAIEARVLLWLVGDEEHLDVYRNGGDPYKDMASVIYGVPVGAVTKQQRELGKRAVLGCGFGMGDKKFHITCAAQGFPVEAKLAKKAVVAYREKYHRVKAFWYDLERAAIMAVETKKVIEFGRLKYAMRDGYLLCRLPSGKCIAYPGAHVAVEESPWGPKKGLRYWSVNDKGQWVRESTYGGKLTENAVQATAREFMVAAMDRVEGHGYPIVFTVHDEVGAETSETFGSLKEFEELMSEVPPWGEGMPIKVEGYRELRYKK